MDNAMQGMAISLAFQPMQGATASILALQGPDLRDHRQLF
jgi:hypothetical protein